MNELPILLVEDEPLVQELLSEALEGAGYKVLIASRGQEALELLDQEATNVSGLVTDINLGAGPKGWDVARRARELHADLPVVYLSGDSAHQWTVQGVPHSVMIQKPFANSQIIVALAELLNARTQDL